MKYSHIRRAVIRREDTGRLTTFILDQYLGLVKANVKPRSKSCIYICSLANLLSKLKLDI